MNKFKIAIISKLKNGKLQEFIEKKGWNQADFAREIGYDQTIVCRWFNMKSYPKKIETLFKISEMLNDTPGNIFPKFLKEKDFLLEKKEITIYKEIENNELPMDSNNIKLLYYDQKIETNEEKEIVKKAWHFISEKLHPREKEVMEYRLGFVENRPLTLLETSSRLNYRTTRENIRQKQRKATKKINRILMHNSGLREKLKYIFPS